MTKIRHLMFLAVAAVALSAAPVIEAQGKGGGEGKGKGRAGGTQGAKSQGKGPGKAKGQGEGSAQGQGQNKGRGPDKAATGNRGQSSENAAARASARASGNARFMRATSPSSMPQSIRRYATSRRAQDVMVAAAVAHAYARGRGDDFRIDQDGNGMRVRNRNGDRLLYLDDESARDLGRWKVGVVGDDVREGSPAFCRSGEGHPVWGRQWCLDKGFGLGSYDDYRWGRSDNIGDIVFAPASIGGSLIGDALANVLGRTAFNRLALHAVTLGLVQPLVGRWVNDANGPQMLMVNSGTVPVAEFVDANRDNRADNMLVALRSW